MNDSSQTLPCSCLKSRIRVTAVLAYDRAISAQNQALIVVGLLVDSQVFRKASIGRQPLDGSGSFFGYHH